MKVIFLLSIIFVAAANECNQVSGNSKKCQCKTKEGFVVDLAKFKPPAKSLHTSKDNFTYLISPCSEITLGTCNSSVCQNTSTGAHDAGAPIQAGTNPFSGHPWHKTLTVNYTSRDTVRNSKLYLICGQGVADTYEALGEGPKNHYEFRLTTEAVCQPAKKSGLSPGSILCIILLVVVLVYLIGGVLFLRFWRGARGVEQFPKYEFWKELPLLIWDGLVFLRNGCKTDQRYDAI